MVFWWSDLELATSAATYELIRHVTAVMVDDFIYVSSTNPRKLVDYRHIVHRRLLMPNSEVLAGVQETILWCMRGLVYAVPPAAYLKKGFEL